jgi:hypothetical protein
MDGRRSVTSAWTDRARRPAAWLAAALCLASGPLEARLLEVGPGKPFARPSQAAAAARAGDVVRIAPGTYRDCAVWRASDLSIEAEGGPVVITGPVCQDKALFVVAAPRVTISGLTFRGAVAPAGNGAGIRAEGGDLTIRRTRFEGNQTGILTAISISTATVVIEESAFIGNGHATDACRGHGLYANALVLLAIRRSRFEATRVCHHVKSRALRTEITDSEILDGAEDMASYQVDIPNGGDLVLARTTIRKGPRAGNMRASVVIGAEGRLHPTRELRIEANRFENLMPQGTTFVRNMTETPAVLAGNRLSGRVIPLEGPGTVR